LASVSSFGNNRKAERGPDCGEVCFMIERELYSDGGWRRSGNQRILVLE
jgi:hypothetical protein